MTRIRVIVIAAFVLCAPAGAAWSTGSSGTGAAAAKTLPTGTTPTATASLFTVTVTWPASSFPEGGTVPAYRVRRFNTVGTASAAANGCSGIVTGTSCVETSVPAGTWRYAVTPAIGAWDGTEGAQGNGVVVPGL